MPSIGYERECDIASLLAPEPNGSCGRRVLGLWCRRCVLSMVKEAVKASKNEAKAAERNKNDVVPAFGFSLQTVASFDRGLLW